LDTTNFFIASYEEGSDEWTMAFQIESGQQGQVEKHKLGPGLTSYVIRTRQPLMLCNLEENRSFFDQQRIGRVGRQCKSWMGVPLNAAGRLVGVMVIQSYEQENLYDDQDLALFTTIASQAAVAVQNARLFEETRRRNEELAIINSISSALSRSLDLNQILEAALEPVLALTGFEAGLVSLVDPATGRLVLTVEHQLPEALANRLRDQGLEGTLCQLVYDRKETVCLTDLSQDPPIDTKGLVKLGLHSYLGIPLESKGQVVGTVCVFGHTARSVPDTAVSSMKAIGRQIGVAIDNAYLYEEVRVRAEEMAVLNEISQKLTAQLDVTDVLEEVYRSASRLLDATNFFVGLYDPNTDQVSFPFYVTSGQHNEDGTVIRSGQGKTGYVVRTRKPLLIKENVAQWRAEHGVEALDPQDALSWLGAPMIVGHRVLGVLAVENYTISRAFDEHDQDILVAIANQAAIALQNAHLYEESQRRINELATLNDISREMASALSLENLYQVLYRQVGRVLNTTNFFIGSYEEGSDEWEIVFRMEQGQPGETGKCKMEAGLSRHIIRTRQPLLLHTVQENNAFFQEHNIERVGPQSKSWMGIPLIAAGQVVGVMAIQSYEQENAYSDQDMALFKTIGAQAAVAFQNARLFEEARTRVEEMATVNELSRVFSTRLDVDRVLKEVYRGASRLMDTTNFYIALYNPQIDEVSFPLYAEGDNIRPLTGRRRGGIGMTEYVIRTRAPLLIEENVQERLREIGIESIGTESYSWLGVPMIVGDQVIGVVAVQSYTTPRVYNEHHRDLLSAIAAQAAVAINNARLFQETHAHAEEMTALNDLSRGLSSRLSVSQVLDEVYRGVSRLLDTTNFYIGLYDPNRQEVSFPLNVTESVADREITTLPADQGITGYIIRTRESVLIRENINAWLDQQGMTPVGEPAQSWLGVPMSVGDQVLGVMAIQDYKTPNLYDEHDQEILITIANQTAIALQNARLFEQTQAARQQAESRVREMEILNRFTREVSSTLDLNHVLDALVNTLEQDMDFSHVSLDLIDEPANAVRTVRAAGLASGMNDLVRPLDQLQNDITIDVARKGQIEIIDGWDDRFDRELFERAGHAKLVRAFVPLLLRDRTVGVLEVGYQRGERAGILDEEISLLRSLADQVVMAVENARLFEQTRARARREQILRQVTEHIRSSSDPDTVMRTLVSELGTVLNRRTFVRLGSAEQLAQAPVPQESGGNPQGAVPGGQPEAEGGK
jgi:GAF domain-containing protein